MAEARGEVVEEVVVAFVPRFGVGGGVGDGGKVGEERGGFVEVGGPVWVGGAGADGIVEGGGGWAGVRGLEGVGGGGLVVEGKGGGGDGGEETGEDGECGLGCEGVVGDADLDSGVVGRGREEMQEGVVDGVEV